jgi:menaquinone-dependent protoporphyrinogen IX oxidase
MVAGAVHYTRYSALVRWLHQILKRQAPDTSHDHEFTDWEAVGRFGDQFDVAVRQTASAVA